MMLMQLVSDYGDKLILEGGSSCKWPQLDIGYYPKRLDSVFSCDKNCVLNKILFYN